VLSTRYDFNSNFYAKLEGHFVDGYYAGFYGVNNVQGLQNSSNLAVLKIGFTF
jgi:hypothetical protein